MEWSAARILSESSAALDATYQPHKYAHSSDGRLRDQLDLMLHSLILQHLALHYHGLAHLFLFWWGKRVRLLA